MKITGLSNYGNTCYLNTFVQIFRFIEPFRTTLKQLADNSPSTTSNSIAKTWNYLYDQMDECSQGHLAPAFWVACVQPRLAKNHIAVMMQNDIHEVYISLINHLITETVQPMPAMDHITNPRNTWERFKINCDKEWTQALQKEWSPIIDTLYGQMITQITCGHCNALHHSSQPFSCIEMELDDTTLDLSGKLSAITNEETLTTWKCDKCQQTTASRKTTAYWRLPPVLVVSFKRFKPLGPPGSGTFSKNMTGIVMNEALSIPTVYDIHDKKTKQYTLHSLAMHQGNLGSGHYYAVTRHPTEGWYEINDATCRPIEDMVQSSLIYMMVYVESQHEHQNCDG